MGEYRTVHTGNVRNWAFFVDVSISLVLRQQRKLCLWNSTWHNGESSVITIFSIFMGSQIMWKWNIYCIPNLRRNFKNYNSSKWPFWILFLFLISDSSCSSNEICLSWSLQNKTNVSRNASPKIFDGNLRAITQKTTFGQSKCSTYWNCLFFKLKREWVIFLTVIWP